MRKELECSLSIIIKALDEERHMHPRSKARSPQSTEWMER
jgi:hypothetical protein